MYKTSFVIPIFWQESAAKLSSFSKWISKKFRSCQTSHFQSVQFFALNWTVHGFLEKCDHLSLHTKKNPHDEYPLHFQIWAALKCILKEVFSFLMLVLEYPNPISQGNSSNYLNLSKWTFQAPLFPGFPPYWLLMLLVDVLILSLSLSGYLYQALVLYC